MPQEFDCQNFNCYKNLITTHFNHHMFSITKKFGRHQSPQEFNCHKFQSSHVFGHQKIWSPPIATKIQLPHISITTCFNCHMLWLSCFWLPAFDHHIFDCHLSITTFFNAIYQLSHFGHQLFGHHIFCHHIFGHQHFTHQIFGH